MPNIKLSEDQLLAKQEMNRLKRFFVQDGFKNLYKRSIATYGIVRLPSDITFNNLKISQGTGADKVTMQAGYAIDSNVDVITNPSLAVDVLTVPTDNVLRYIIIGYDTNLDEEGTLDIASDGVLTGYGTLFTEVPRGQPNFPVKIKLTNSVGNLLEYEVLEVIDDVTAQLSGATFVAEFGLTYSVVGTFTPGKSIPTGDKFIYEYDYYTLRLSTTNNAISGLEFVLGTVQTNGTTMILTDLRGQSLYTLNNSAATLNPITNSSNLFGVEQAMFANKWGDKSKNIVRVGWGFRSLSGNWVANVSNNKAIINAGNGGIFASVSDFTTGDFNGWRCYFVNTGKFANVVTSVLVTGTIELNLDYYDPSFATTGDLIVVPNAEEIEITAAATLLPKASRSYFMPILPGYADLVFDESAIEISCRHKLVDFYSPFFPVNDGNYIDETSFDNQGVLVSPNTSAVSSGVLTLKKEGLIRWQQSTVLAPSVSGTTWSPSKESNTYNFTPYIVGIGTNLVLNAIADLGNGTELTVYNNDYVNGNYLAFNLNIVPPVGFLKIRCKFADTLTAPITQIRVEGDDSDCLVLKQIEDVWHIISIGKFVADEIDKKANKVTEAWKLVGAVGQPAFENSWVNYLFGADLGFRKNDMGIVTLRGSIRGGNVDPVTGSIFTLPLGYRPTDDMYFMTEVFDVATPTNRNTLTIEVKASNGKVYAYGVNPALPTLGADVATNLDGISFYTD